MAVQNAFCDIPIFSGEDKSYPLKTWIASIELAMSINQWPMERMMTLIRARVSGAAARKLDAIPQERVFADGNDLVATLRGIFADTSSADARLEELYRFGQRFDESIGQLGERVRSVISAISPNAFDENLAIKAFVSALKNGNVKFDLRRNMPGTLTDAVNRANSFDKEWQTCFNTPQVAMQPMQPNQFNQQRYQFQQEEPMEIDQQFLQGAKCYYCEKQGHIASNCVLMKQHMGLLKKYEARLASRNRGRGRGRGRGTQPRAGTSRGRPLRYGSFPRHAQLRERDVQELKDAIAQIQNFDDENETDDLNEHDYEEGEHEEQAEEEQQQINEQQETQQGFQ